MASASVLATGRPCTTSRTASSLSLLLRVRGQVGHRDDLRGDVARRRTGAHPPPDLGLEVDGQLVARRHDDEAHDPRVALPLLTDDQAVGDAGHGLDLAGDLRGADAHAARVEGRVGAAVDHHAAVRGPLGVVALVPAAREAGEVGGPEPDVVGVGPQAERDRRERGAAHQLAPRAGRERRAVGPDDVDGQPERRPLDLAREHRPGGVAADEAPAQVGPARDRREVHVGLHRVVHVGEALGEQRRARRRDGAHAPEVVGVARAHAGLAQLVEEPGRGAEQA